MYFILQSCDFLADGFDILIPRQVFVSQPQLKSLKCLLWMELLYKGERTICNTLSCRENIPLKNWISLWPVLCNQATVSVATHIVRISQVSAFRYPGCKAQSPASVCIHAVIHYNNRNLLLL